MRRGTRGNQRKAREDFKIKPETQTLTETLLVSTGVELFIYTFMSKQFKKRNLSHLDRWMKFSKIHRSIVGILTVTQTIKTVTTTGDHGVPLLSK